MPDVNEDQLSKLAAALLKAYGEYRDEPGVRNRNIKYQRLLGMVEGAAHALFRQHTSDHLLLEVMDAHKSFVLDDKAGRDARARNDMIDRLKEMR